MHSETLTRNNVVRLCPHQAQRNDLRLIADRVSALYNAANYLQRQWFLDPEQKALPTTQLEKHVRQHCDEYRRLPSDIAQETIKKLGEAWASYWALRKRWQAGDLPNKPGLPRYRKDRRTHTRPADLIPIKTHRSYRCAENQFDMTLPRDLKVARHLPANARLVINHRGTWTYSGKAGRVELKRELGRWRCHQSVTMTRAVNTIRPQRFAGIDLGICLLVSLSIEGVEQALHFGGRAVNKTWRYWGRRIAACQAQLAASRGKRSSKRLRLLYRRRRLALRHAWEALARAVVSVCRRHGVTDLVIGHPKGIRDQVSTRQGRQAANLHNFWSFNLSAGILANHAELAQIRVHRKPERGTSSTCPWDPAPLGKGTHTVVRYPRERLTCKTCQRSLHSDQAGSRNMIRTVKPGISWDRPEAGPRPEHRVWNGHTWQPAAKRGRQPLTSGSALVVNAA